MPEEGDTRYGPRDERWLVLLGWQDKLKEEALMANNKIARIQGTAAPQPGQGARTLNSGTGTAKIGNDRNSICPLFESAKPEPGQGPRIADSGAGGCASLAGRGTMEQK